MAVGIASAIGLAAASIPIAANNTLAISGDSQALPGSTFEIDEDANLIEEDADPSDDWGTVAETIGFDIATGHDDNSYVGGTKEDTVCPGETTGSIPNNKSDLLTFHAYTEHGDPGFFNLGWSRVSEPNGTTLLDIEFNQSSVGCATGPNLQRTDGDLLIEYGIDKGGKVATLLARHWIGDASTGAWSEQEEISVANPLCGGNPCAVGTINQSPIPLAESYELNADKDPFTFGEAQIDLRYIFKDDQCISFGSALLKSRSSDSFTSQLKDFIAPIPINLRNCGSVRIEKQTVPDGSTADFGFTSDVATDGGTDLSAFTLSDGESVSNGNVLFGTYTVTESSLPAGWELDDIDCSAGNVTPDSEVGAALTFTIDDASDSLDCTYTNEAKAQVTFAKVADYDGVDFSFTGSGGLADFALANGESMTFSDLAPGTYGATETVPDGWAQDSATCDNGDTPDAVTLTPGDDVLCTITNSIRGSITYVKDAERGGVDFDFTGDHGPFALADGESTTFTDLVAGTYATAETVPAGWNLTSFDCDGGEVVSGVVIDEPGESVTCTAVNVIQRGAIDISKVAKDAANGGEKPLEGVTFTVTNANNGTSEEVVTNADGLACVSGLPVSVLDGDYTVTETVPTGYAPVDPQDVTVVESSCGTAEAVDADFVNIPLTNVTISVDSQVDGGTASIMECVSDEYGSTGEIATGADGDGSVTVNDLSPTAPAVTITCTVVIDP